MYDGHYRRQVRREPGSLSATEEREKRQRQAESVRAGLKGEKKSATHLPSEPFFRRTQGPLMGEMAPQDSKGLLPILTSALCSCTVRDCSTWHAPLSLSLSLSVSLSPQSCITNNGLTCVPLINTSADKLASHTSILVWGRLISGAHTGFEHMCRSHGTVEAPANYQTSDGPFLPPPFSFPSSTFWLRAWPLASPSSVA